jgi:hypothetical protein
MCFKERSKISVDLCETYTQVNGHHTAVRNDTTDSVEFCVPFKQIRSPRRDATERQQACFNVNYSTLFTFFP